MIATKAPRLDGGWSMKKIAEHIHGYTYGTSKVTPSSVSMQELDELKISVGFTEEDQRCL